MGSKSRLYAGLVLAVLIVCGCETLERETQIDYGVYDVYQIVDREQPLPKTDYFLDGFTLSYKSSDTYKEKWNDDETSVTKFTFYEDDVEVCKVEITESVRAVSAKQDFIFAMLQSKIYEKHIKFIYNDGTVKEYEIASVDYNFDPAEIYATFEKSQNEIVTIVNYYSSGYNSGLEILVNNERYGILAYYPLAFHLEKEKPLEKDMALYILATYASLVYDSLYHKLEERSSGGVLYK